MTSLARPELRIVRVRSFTSDAQLVLAEYYESVGVIQRDDADAMRLLLQDERSAMWLAFRGTDLAGCVALRAGVPQPDAGECKRMYVRPDHRRSGVAAGLMEALERFAAESGLRWVYLDTNEAFAASVALYRQRGYEPCDRYNNNPQATMFFRKRL